MLKLLNKNPKGSIIVEAIAATLILSLVMVASTPPILMAVFTRVQSRRVNQSMQLAQQEVEKVREIFSTGYSLGTTTSYTSADLPPVATGKLRSTVASTAAPTAICTTSCTATQGKIVTLNNQQFLVQTFSSNQLMLGTVTNLATGQPNPPIAFRMGVRVYSSTAIAKLQAGGTLSATQSSSIGLSSSENPQSQSPLVAIYTDFVRGDLTSSQQAYTTFLSTY
jgi:hypothetical protein